MSDNSKVETYNEEFQVKSSCLVINYSEVPVKLIAITNPRFLKGIPHSFEREYGRRWQIDNDFDAPGEINYFNKYVKEYKLEEYDHSVIVGDPAYEKLVDLSSNWTVIAIYMDFEWEDKFTLWRFCEASKGMIINIRDGHIDGTQYADNEVEIVKIESSQNIDEIIASIERKNNKKIEDIPLFI